MIGLPWHTVQVIHPEGHSQRHLVPVNDIVDHRCSEMCGCEPEEDDAIPDLWRHNALDGRESYEQGRKMH